MSQFKKLQAQHEVTFNVFITFQVMSSVLNEVESRLEMLSHFSLIPDNAEYVASELENIIDVLGIIIQNSRNNERPILLRQRAYSLQLTVINCLTVTSTASINAVGIAGARVTVSRGRGRPRINLNMDQIELLREAGYTWNEVGECFVSE